MHQHLSGLAEQPAWTDGNPTAVDLIRRMLYVARLCGPLKPAAEERNPPN